MGFRFCFSVVVGCGICWLVVGLFWCCCWFVVGV